MGFTHRATLEGRVQGVVVQARREVFSIILDLEAHDGRDFLDVLVALGHLVAGQGGAAAGAVGDDLVPLVEQALVVDLLQATTIRISI